MLERTFNYPTQADQHVLEPSADASDMRLTLHIERIYRLELQQIKIEIVADTLAREVAELRVNN